MADVNRQLLDSLLGPDRNTSFHKRPNRHINYYDEVVCKRFLVSVCYNELWKHTKYDTEGEYF